MMRYTVISYLISNNIEQISKQQCHIFLVHTTHFRAVADYKSYDFYKYSCKIIRYFIFKREWGLGHNNNYITHSSITID